MPSAAAISLGKDMESTLRTATFMPYSPLRLHHGIYQKKSNLRGFFVVPVIFFYWVAFNSNEKYMNRCPTHWKVGFCRWKPVKMNHTLVIFLYIYINQYNDGRFTDMEYTHICLCTYVCIYICVSLFKLIILHKSSF